MRILITGGCGFIGSHLCRKYVGEGHNVIALDNLINGSINNVRDLIANRNFKFVKGDVRNIDLLDKICNGIDAIMHLAAQIHVDRSIIEPQLTYGVNVIGTLNVLEMARRHDVKRIIHASTSEVYGSGQYIPMDENHPLDAPHPYGASKIAADRMCFSYAKTFGMDIRIVRCFNIFGPGQKDTGYGGAISLFVRRILSNLPPIIYGSGNQTRDYMYVDDAVKACDLVLKSDAELSGEAINFGTGREISIIDLANLLIKLCGQEGKLKSVHVAPRPGEIIRLCADTTKAQKLLNFRPSLSLEEGLIKFIEWYANYRFAEWEKPG